MTSENKPLVSDTPFEFITDTHTLSTACSIWQSKSALALDTEFIRTNTFYPVPALIQVYDGEKCTLIDITTIEDLQDLKTLIENPAITKIFHACGEDLEVIDRLLETLPKPLFDTQTAAALLGHGFSVGYSRLVKQVLDQDLPLDESRSDWLQRPLTPKQTEYAILDVFYLYQLYQQFYDVLKDSEKSQWFQACCEEQISNYYNNQVPENYFQRFKNAWRLNSQQQQLLYKLALWRENTARQQNKPRNWIINDKGLYAIALRKPKQISGLQNIEDLHPRSIREYGDEVIALINSNSQITEKHSIPPPLPKHVSNLSKSLKQCAQVQAEALNIAPEMLARKKTYQDFIRSGYKNGKFTLPDELCGWRKDLIGDRFLQLAEQWYTNG